MYAKKEISKWLLELSNYNTPNLDSLPNIDLYMDQVISLIEERMHHYLLNDNSIITQAMIHNYVKAEIIPAPKNKKYNKEHLAYIISICSLKQILPINDISLIIGSDDYKKTYEKYKEMADKSAMSTAGLVKRNLATIKKENEDEELRMLALKLAIEANNYKMASERILDALEKKKAENIEAIKEKVLSTK